MIPSAKPEPQLKPLFDPLPWDSNHFGFPIARIRRADLNNGMLESALERARGSGIRLVYWAANVDRPIPESMLQHFCGKEVDLKATFFADLGTVLPESPHREPTDLRIYEYAEGAATVEMESLAIAAGAHSRFRVDPRIPKTKFEEMYVIWIRRSTLHELADAVIVAASPCQETLGFATISISNSIGQIGLIAVDETSRGMGMGGALVKAAQRWMKVNGAEGSRVVTQLANSTACKLYERCGYHLQTVERFFHFWL